MEKFDFSKQEDRAQFEKLSEKSKTAVISKAETEARTIDNQRTKTASLVEKYNLSKYKKRILDISKQPEEYQEYYKEYNRILVLSNAVQNKAVAIGAAGGPEMLRKLRNSINKFAEKLKAAYPNYQEYAAWHILYYSSPSPLGQPNIDFPGGFSVEKFLIEQLEKLEKNI